MTTENLVSQEAEIYVLSCCFLDGRNALTVCSTSGLTSACFALQPNRVIFETMQGLHAQGRSLDLDVVAEELAATKKIESVGGFAYLAQVSRTLPTDAQLPYFVNRVVELHQLRSVIAAASRVIERAKTYSGENVGQWLGRDIERLTEVVQGRAQARPWKSVVLEAKEITAEKMKPEAERSEKTISIPWAWPSFDTEFQPMDLGELVVVAARPSVGKSTLARMQAIYAAMHGYPTLLTSLEVTDTELAINLAANITGIRSRKNLVGLHHKDAADLLAGFDTLAEVKPFAVCHEDEWLSEMIGRARAFKARHGLRLWVIDYLQLIADCQGAAGGRGVNEASAIGSVTCALKRFAVREGIVIMLLSQLNRESEREDREPRLSDLRGSGAIEQDANRIIFLHRPSEIPAQFTSSGLTEIQSSTDDRDWHFINLIQAKGRNHGTGEAALRLDRATATLRRLAKS